MNDEKINLNITRLFPEVVMRLKILEALKSSWPSIVGAAAKHSVPYDLILDNLYVAAENQHTAQMIQNMRGNITRALITRYKYNENAKINVIIRLGRPPVMKAIIKPAQDNAKSQQAVIINDEQVNKYISECPEDLPDDAKLAISHLRAYLENMNY
ncbi:MAG: DUF721 domain-containing protein [Synergistaceae bacterium]|nr:DUF721 domain-containing protein [Synergistaceae bacterium]